MYTTACTTVLMFAKPCKTVWLLLPSNTVLSEPVSACNPDEFAASKNTD